MLLSAVMLFSCKKEYSGWNVYYSSKINLVNVPANDDCPSGGVMVLSGLDKNQNDLLDSGEVDQSELICNGTAADGSPDENITSPKQVIISLDMMTSNTTSATPITVGKFPLFSKNNYPGYDSIVLVAWPYISEFETNTATIDLYDLTNNAKIANSTLSSSKNWEQSGFVVSHNLYSSLPEEEISLGLQIKSANEGRFAGVYALYLYLYRK